MSANWLKTSTLRSRMFIREHFFQRLKLCVLGGVPFAELDKEVAQGRGVRRKVFAETRDKVSRGQPAKAPLVSPAKERVDLRSTLSEVIFGSQRRGCAGFSALLVVIRIKHIADGRVGILVERMRVQEARVRGPDGKRLIILDGVKKNEVAENVSLYRQQERMTAAFQAFEQVSPAESLKPFAGAGQVAQNPFLGACSRLCRRRHDVVAQAVTREFEAAYGTHHVLREKLRILVVDIEPNRLRDACWK